MGKRSMQPENELFSLEIDSLKLSSHCQSKSDVCAYPKSVLSSFICGLKSYLEKNILMSH